MKFFKALLLIFFFIPAVAQAAGVGFVPSTGLWFSKTEFAPQEMVRVYTVIINNEYPKLAGLVGFYDNGGLIDSVEIKNLLRDSALQLKILWQPTEGPHLLSARFLRAIATDGQGQEQMLGLDQINSLTGAPLKIGGSAVVPIAQVAELSAQTEASTPSLSRGLVSEEAKTISVGSMAVVVEKNGDKLVLAAEPLSLSAARVAGRGPGLEESVRDVFAKNREIIGKAERIAGTITTTVATAEKAYGAAKSAVEQGQAIYAKGEEYWNKVEPYAAKVKPVWEKISNNNEPKRVAIIIGGAVIIFWLIRRSIRRGEFRN